MGVLPLNVNSVLLDPDGLLSLDNEEIIMLEKKDLNKLKLFIKWALIEPVEGEFDYNIVQQYKDIINKIKSSNLDVVVILCDNFNPSWFNNRGGFVNDKSIELFERYTEYIARNIGDAVSYWITINKPNRILYNYKKGDHKLIKSNRDYILSCRNIILSHIRSYRKIHEISLNLGKDDVKAGVSFELGKSVSKGDCLSKIAEKQLKNLFHEIFISGMCEGKFIKPLGNNYPYGKGKYLDFFGVCYGGRYLTEFNLKEFIKGFYNIRYDADNYSIESYKDEVVNICRRYFERYNLPVFIVESNGDDYKSKKIVKKFCVD